MDTQKALENGPVALVPAAWTVAGATETGLLGTRSLLIAHGVMAVLIAVFATLGWGDMSEGVLRVWRGILVAGLPVTVSGFVGLYTVAEPLTALALYGWFLLPAVGFVYTALEVDAPSPYALGAILSVVGALAYAVPVVPPVAGIALVGIGQTVGIADAVYRY
jgi:hypothetical protein